MTAVQKLSARVTQGALNQTALDWPRNMGSHYSLIDIAHAQGSDIVLAPELSATAYEVNDDFQRTDNTRIYEALSNIAAYANAIDPDMIISIGHPWRLQLRKEFESASADPDLIKNPLYDRMNLPFNVQTLISDGKIISMTAKANLFNDERGYEKRYFNEWSFGAAEQVAKLMGVESTYGTIPVSMPDGRIIPFGRPIVYVTDRNGNNYVHAQAICEEKWVATKFDGAPGDDTRYEQFNIIPSISRYLGTTKGLFLEIANASPPSRGKQTKHMHLNDLASNYADIVVDTDGLGTSGASFAQFGHRLISQNGKTISAGNRMEFSQVSTTTSTVKLHKADPSLEKLAHATITRNFKAPKAKQDAKLTWNIKDSKGQWDNPTNPDQWKEERLRNQALWMFDYMRKTKSKGIAEALSGGKDSSFNCAMVRVMVELAMNDLGVEGFCKEMSHLPYIDKIMDAYRNGGKEAAVKACMSDMLTTVYMGTNNSSFETWYAAKTLIDGGEFEDNGDQFEGIGGKFLERNVQDLVTNCAMTFGIENTSKIPLERRTEIFEELAKFVHASPYDYSPAQMKTWAQTIQKDFPEVLTLTSAALPGQGIAYENFQARIREVLIMAVANVESKMAVANPNLDEAYGAYATFGGDLHSGTVNWNAGLHKEDQEALMDYLEEKGVQGVMDRIVSLAPANNNKPTAELQPKKDGKVVQNDEDALQGTFPQKAILARLRHHTKIDTDGNGQRWMNAGELFKAAQKDPHFSALNDNQMFNAVTNFYSRWEGPAQHKIHATPIAQSFGESVDHQTSLRTPNLSGGSRDEITMLGVELLFDWADQDQITWSADTYDMARNRAWQDDSFINTFYNKIWNRDEAIQGMNYNLRGLYTELQDEGWDNTFPALDDDHPIQVIRRANHAPK